MLLLRVHNTYRIVFNRVTFEGLARFNIKLFINHFVTLLSLFREKRDVAFE